MTRHPDEPLTTGHVVAGADVVMIDIIQGAATVDVCLSVCLSGRVNSCFCPPSFLSLFHSLSLSWTILTVRPCIDSVCVRCVCVRLCVPEGVRACVLLM